MTNPEDTPSGSNIDEVIVKTISDVLSKGTETQPAKFSNNDDSYMELENYMFILNNPLDRIPINPFNPLNLISLIGRFVWIIAGNDRVEDIAFYQDKVRIYSDNGLTVPGSDYGKRIFNPDEGTDQIANVIELLQEDPHSRRAIIPILFPSDSARFKSKDFSCAFGLAFRIKNNKLHSTLIMRSNNALRLLNVNLFEFTLIGEIVARELGIEYERHTHLSISMHIFQSDVKKIMKWIDLPEKETCSTKTRIPMPIMPKSPHPLSEAKTLAKLEAKLRNDNVLKDPSHIYVHLESAKEELSSYWYEFYKVLVIGALVHANEHEKAQKIAKELPPYFKIPILRQLDKPMITSKSDGGTLDHFLPPQSPSFYSTIKEAFKPDEEEACNIFSNLETYVEQIEKETEITLTGKEYRFLQKKILNKTVIAARSTGKDKDSNDLKKISKDEIKEEIHDIVKRRD